MKVRDIMTVDVQSCTGNTSLTDAAALMWNTGCGAIPVVNARGKIMGIMTDRDIAMALIKARRPASMITARDAMTPYVHSCSPDDELTDVLRIMKEFKVRRVPVIATDRRLCGIFSIDDLISRPLGPGAPTCDEMLDVLRTVFHGRALNAGKTPQREPLVDA
jgi:CBS domain-containing protein